MSVTVRTNPAGGASAAFPDDYNRQNDLQQATQRGYARVDFDDYADGATEPKVANGSEFEVDGDVVYVSGADEAITGLAGIANDNDVYIYYDVSAVGFAASTTAPAWDSALGGWYDAGTGDRALLGLYKDGSGDYTARWVYLPGKAGLRQYGDGSMSTTAVKDGLDVLISFSSTPDNQAIGATSSWVVPKGIYMFANNTVTSLVVQIFDGSTWIGSGTVGVGGMFWSDGTNIRITNGSAGSITVYYRKLI